MENITLTTTELDLTKVLLNEGLLSSLKPRLTKLSRKQKVKHLKINIMKKAVFTIVLSLVAVVTFAQTKEVPQRLKYVTTGPDGSVAMTIIDDTREDVMKLESADHFYKYQILDTRTAEPVYSASNKGKACEIDKTKLAAGTYNLKLYTSNFVITSKITVSATRKLNNAIKADQTLAANMND